MSNMRALLVCIVLSLMYVSCDDEEGNYAYGFESSYVNQTEEALVLEVYNIVDTFTAVTSDTLSIGEILTFEVGGIDAQPQPFGLNNEIRTGNLVTIRAVDSSYCRSYTRQFRAFDDGGEEIFNWSLYEGFDPEFINNPPGDNHQLPQLTYVIDSAALELGTPCL